MRKIATKLLTPEELAFHIGWIAFDSDVYKANYDDKNLADWWLRGFTARGAMYLINTPTILNNTKAKFGENEHELTKKY